MEQQISTLGRWNINGLAVPAAIILAMSANGQLNTLVHILRMGGGVTHKQSKRTNRYDEVELFSGILFCVDLLIAGVLANLWQVTEFTSKNKKPLCKAACSAE